MDADSGSVFRRRELRGRRKEPGSRDDSALREGRRIGSFTLTRFIAKGGMGQVWEAQDSELRRRVALKLVLPDRIDERSLALFAREARAGGRVHHPNLVTTFGHGTDEGMSWIAQELVEGAWTLKHSLDALRADDAVPKGYYREVAELVARIADGLEAAHDAGVIHRDLKPQNILIADDDQPKVTDFGLARVADDSFLSRTGDFGGTWAYMSPEQVTAKRMGLDHRTDVFSLGVVLYELLTLRRPFEGDTTHQIAQEIVYAEPTDASRVRSQCPRELAVIAGKALEKLPASRYQTMGEFAADLRRHLANEPILAKPPTALQRAVKWARRHPAKSVSGAIASVAFVLIAGLAMNLKRANADLDASNKSLETKTEELQASTTLLERKTKEAEDNAEQSRVNAEQARKNAEVAETNAKTAEANAAAERKRADEVLRLSLLQDYENLMVLQAELWPPYPEQIPALKQWIADATKLTEELPSLIAKRDELRASALPQTEAESRERESHPDYPRLMQLEGRLSVERAALEVRRGGEPAPLPEFDEDEYPAMATELRALAASLLDAGREEFGREGLGVVLAEEAVNVASEEEEAACWATLARGLLLLGRDEAALGAMGEAVASAAEGEEATRYRQELAAMKTAVREAASSSGSRAAEDALAELESTRDELRARVEARRTWTFSEESEAQSRTRWWHVQLTKLIGDLESLLAAGTGQLVADGVSEEHGWSVARRLASAERLRDGFAVGGEYAERWASALPGIRRAYPGLELPVQMGLVPIGDDPDSGLWEFWHVQTGVEPVRGEDGKLVMEEESGLVFVLLPGGKFWMGAQSRDASGRNYDEGAEENEAPPHEVELSAFFLSKFEMTQGQWKRIAGANPSSYGPDGEWIANWSGDGSGGDLLQPVEQVSWLECRRAARHLRLNIPTEAQWEYGCRAGTSSVYWSGSDVTSLEGVANIADEYARKNGASGTWNFKSGFEDGFTFHAPIGSFRANEFGLHGVHGNVWEWCRDSYVDYDTRVESGTGMRLRPSAYRVYRGGSFNLTARDARSANRGGDEPDSSGWNVGFRPSQDLSF